MIEAIFHENINVVSVSGLFQWDYGQRLKIKGLDLPPVVEVHFSNNLEKEAIVMVGTQDGDDTVVDIPDVLLTKYHDITAYVYVIGSNSGETVKAVILKVEPRVKPQNFVKQVPDADIVLSDVVDKINQNIADNASFKQTIETEHDAFMAQITADQEEYQAQWDAEVEQSITEAQQATNQAYDVIGALQVEMYDMNGGDPFTEISEDDMDANGGYPA